MEEKLKELEERITKLEEAFKSSVDADNEFYEGLNNLAQYGVSDAVKFLKGVS